MRALSTLLCTAFALALLGAPAGAEDGRKHTDKAQAELHIHVMIAPVVFPPRHKDRDHDHAAAVVYNLSAPAEEFTITQETRSMAINGLKQEQVQLTTVVLK
jgi:hypothetical protein